MNEDQDIWLPHAEEGIGAILWGAVVSLLLAVIAILWRFFQ